ncbi:hypothetical protein SAMN04487846_2908 [Microbacterium sp. cf046]|uniref:DUF2255 family protein n=1 Tax=Microbacterium sp. cf046 TaxID=1761803 RepID=UPI0008E6A565|nr:DUF2255 family protein [Microbacterium sp. cf046]SFS14373.1 hypothetical protein SAMN04487846_2908 [Microbacterium sp. cf046]
MSDWTESELTRIGGAEELRVASIRRDGTQRPYVIVWVVRAGEGLYVRSAYGSDNPWFRRAVASGAGRVKAGGLESAVSFEQVGDEVNDAVDAAYHAKYDKYGARIVGTVVGPEAWPTTLRLVSRTE